MPKVDVYGANATEEFRRWLDVKEWKDSRYQERSKKIERLEKLKKPPVYMKRNCGQGSEVDGPANEQLRLLSRQTKDEELESCVEYSFAKPRCAQEGFPLTNGGFLRSRRYD